MAIMKRGNIWWIYYTRDGQRFQISSGTSNRREAEQIAERKKQEDNLRRHQVPNYSPRMTFGELAVRFVANAHVRPHHTDRLKVLLPYFTDIPIGRITKATAQEYRRCRHDEKPALTDTTINRDLEVARHLLAWAVDEGLLATNPLAGMRMVRERRRRRPVLSVEEEIQLLKSAADHLRPIIITALDAGMRRGEILNQRWEDIDFPRRLLSVTKSKTAEGEGDSADESLTEASLSNATRERIGIYVQRPIHSPHQDRMEGFRPASRHPSTPFS